jgi:hypothetical protein
MLPIDTHSTRERETEDIYPIPVMRKHTRKYAPSAVPTFGFSVGNASQADTVDWCRYMRYVGMYTDS